MADRSDPMRRPDRQARFQDYCNEPAEPVQGYVTDHRTGQLVGHSVVFEGVNRFESFVRAAMQGLCASKDACTDRIGPDEIRLLALNANAIALATLQEHFRITRQGDPP